MNDKVWNLGSIPSFMAVGIRRMTKLASTGADLLSACEVISVGMLKRLKGGHRVVCWHKAERKF